MKDLLDYVKLLGTKSPDATDQLVESIESIYFLYIRHWYIPLSRTEPIRIAIDLVHIEEALRTGMSLKAIRIKSKLLNGNNLINKYKSNVILESHVIDQIKDQVITPHRHYVPAAMIAEIIRRDNARERLRWLTTIILSILTTLIAILLKELGDLNG